MSSKNQKAKIKFHQPSIQELQTQKMSQIFDMLKKQQQGISSLLKKYQNYEQQDLNEVFSRKPKPSVQKKINNIDIANRRSLSLKKSRSKNNIILPELSNQSKQNQRLLAISNRKKIKNFSTIERSKNTLRKDLEIIYNINKKSRQRNNRKQIGSKLGNSRTKKSLQQSTIMSESNNIQSSRQKSISLATPNMTSSLGASKLLKDHNSQQTNEIPQPLSLRNSLIYMSKNNYQYQSDPSDSQDQQIPLAYYQRQFKQKMTAQCIEQINYLYFSKNQSIKDWSQSLLLMFEKHDKEITGLRKKMNYLQKFDDKFFAIDIYKAQ